MCWYDNRLVFGYNPAYFFFSVLHNKATKTSNVNIIS